jgi:hypothetical protein
VWSSPDGVTWTEATAAAQWSKRQHPTLAVHDGKMWILGGYTGNTYMNDVWSSTDGSTWTQETASADWPGRSNHTTAVHDGKLWVLGGNLGAGVEANDVWSSADGVTWTQLKADHIPWPARRFHTTESLNGKLWLMGGLDENNAYLNDVWSSPDGANWTIEITEALWPARSQHASAAFDGKLWVLGGDTASSGSLNDVWSTSEVGGVGSPPVIELNGSATIFLECGVDSYEELGATATDDADSAVQVVIDSSAVDPTALGTYTVTYDATDSDQNAATQVTRTVTVQDTTAPVITLNGLAAIALIAGVDSYVEEGAAVSDACDAGVQVVTAGQTVDPTTPDEYVVTYNATDAEGNVADEVTRTVTVVANNPSTPVITLSGSATLTLECGVDSYEEFGADIADSGDPNVAVVIAGQEVNASVSGVYVVTYNATNIFGNSAAEVTRTVTVEDTQPPVISLEDAASITVALNSVYTDAGATALDACEGDMTGHITTTNNVDTSVAGTYSVLYDVTDSSNNAAEQVSRTVIVTDGSGLADLCGLSDTLDSQFTQFKADFGIVSDDFDDDGLPEEFALGMVKLTACEEETSDLQLATISAYVINLGILEAESQFDDVAAYKDILAVLLSMSDATRTAVLDILANADLSVLLAGEYVVVTCDSTGCLPALIGKDEYIVADGAVKAINEPYSAEGDLDGDQQSNAVEYDNVIASGGGLSYFLSVAGNDLRDGTEAPSQLTDIDGDDSVGATDVQLVINGALGIDIGFNFADVDLSGGVDAVDVQLVINSALGVR